MIRPIDGPCPQAGCVLATHVRSPHQGRDGRCWTGDGRHRAPEPPVLRDTAGRPVDVRRLNASTVLLAGHPLDLDTARAVRDTLSAAITTDPEGDHDG